MRATAVVLVVGVVAASILACEPEHTGLCSGPAGTLDSAASRYYAEHTADYAGERAAFAPVSDRVCRQSDILRIRQRSGRTIEFVDTIIEGDRWRTSSYRRFDPALRSHVVELRFYESGVVMLVPDSAGPVAILDGIPILSPDARRFAVASMSLESGYEPNSIDVWLITDTGAVREFRAEGDPWGPDSLAWASSDSIGFLRTTLDTSDLSYRRVPEVLVRRDSRWQIGRIP